MHFFQLFTLSLVSAVVSATPKLLICSDSTTANYTSGDLQGWGYYIHDYLSINVINLARNGRSTRSFINDGLWAALLAQTSSSDIVVIEMGHNDDGDPTTDTDERAVLPGILNNTVAVTLANGTTETVHSFGWYLRKMIVDVRVKSAVPVLSGMVPRNYWTGNTLQSDWPFADYAKQVATQTAIEYVDHTKYSVNRWQALGSTKAATYYPDSQSTHTDAAGAVINAEAFVTAVQCESPTSTIKQWLNTAGKAINYAC